MKLFKHVQVNRIDGDDGDIDWQVQGMWAARPVGLDSSGAAIIEIEEAEFGPLAHAVADSVAELLREFELKGE